jgi:Domain of unknown function (DUF4136)
MQIMNARIIQLIFVGILFMAVRCGTYTNVWTNYDRSIDFSQYKTFAWAPDSGAVVPKDLEAYDNDIVRNNVKNYITHGLTSRGFLVNIDSPDLILNLVLLNEKQEKIMTYHSYPYNGYYFYNPYYFPYYYPYYRYYTWYGWGPTYFDDRTTTVTKTYVKGTITINMYDRKLKKLIWTGSAEGDIYDPKYIQHDVHPAIDRIMKEFPVKAVQEKKLNEDLKIKDRVTRTSDFNRYNGNRSFH